MATIQFEETAIPGLLLVHPRVIADERGSFIKTFDAATYAAAGLATSFSEEYHTHSRQGVVRGMHLQLPPHAHDKVVFCTRGAVTDVVVDLRVGSPTYREALSFSLDGPTSGGVYIPAGCAHGFCSVSELSTLSYRTTSAHSPSHDVGVLWSSIEVEWPVSDPTISVRDACFPPLLGFVSPFVYETA